MFKSYSEIVDGVVRSEPKVDFPKTAGVETPTLTFKVGVKLTDEQGQPVMEDDKKNPGQRRQSELWINASTSNEAEMERVLALGLRQGDLVSVTGKYSFSTFTSKRDGQVHKMHNLERCIVGEVTHVDSNQDTGTGAPAWFAEPSAQPAVKLEAELDLDRI